MFDQAFGTPAVVAEPGGEEEIVIGVPEEVWGFVPETGKLKWHATIPMNGNLSPSVVADEEGVVYVFGGYRTRGSAAIRAGGEGDVTDSAMVWQSRESSYIPSPVVHEGHVYWINERGKVSCMDKATGEVLNSVTIEGELAGGAKSRGVYASMVLADGRLYCPSRVSGTFVFEATPELKQVAQNRFTGDESDFNGSPAVSGGRIYLRSNGALYCVGEAG
jgi:outer membrane protein assembly factor BamB